MFHFLESHVNNERFTLIYQGAKELNLKKVKSGICKISPKKEVFFSWWNPSTWWDKLLDWATVEEDIDILIPESVYKFEITAAGLLAANGETEAVNFLKKHFEPSLICIAFGYALAGDTKNTEETISQISDMNIEDIAFLAYGYSLSCKPEQAENLLQSTSGQHRLIILSSILYGYFQAKKMQDAYRLLTQESNLVRLDLLLLQMKEDFRLEFFTFLRRLISIAPESSIEPYLNFAIWETTNPIPGFHTISSPINSYCDIFLKLKIACLNKNKKKKLNVKSEFNETRNLQQSTSYEGLRIDDASNLTKPKKTENTYRLSTTSQCIEPSTSSNLNIFP